MTPASGCARSAGCRPAWTSRDGARAESYLPEGVTVTPRPERALSDLLASGEIDAVIFGPPAAVFHAGSARRAPPVCGFPPGGGALFRPDRDISHHACDRDAAARVRGQSMDRAQSARRLRNGQAGGLGAPARYQTSHLPSAWATDEMERVHKLLFPDGDCWPYGLAPNRTTLEAFWPTRTSRA